MSRSYKKYGIIKDKGMSRGEYNRRFRRVNRQRIKEGKEPKLIYEVTNQYDVCDFKMYWERSYYVSLLQLGIIKNTDEINKIKRLYFNK